MLVRASLRVVALAAMLSVASNASAQTLSKYPDWSGSWRITGGNRWDPTKPGGRGR